jgi:hypothetical protein
MNLLWPKRSPAATPAATLGQRYGWYPADTRLIHAVHRVSLLQIDQHGKTPCREGSSQFLQRWIKRRELLPGSAQRMHP